MAHYAYVAVAGEGKILIFTMDPKTGFLSHQEDIPVEGGPGPLAVDPQQKFMYVSVRSNRRILTMRIDSANGSLTHLSSVSVDADSCFLATDRKGRFLLSAYYGAGVAAVHRIGNDGAVVSPAVEWISTAEHAHSIQTDPTNRYVFVPHVCPPNAIFQFLFDETGKLKPNSIPKIVPSKEDGPRHFCFHPNGKFVYFCNEQGCSVTAYRLDSSTGTLTPFQTVSTLPESFREENSCAEIRMHPSGKFVYASNRGHDSIACFAINSKSGELTSLREQPTETTPRAFSLDPEGNYLYSAGIGSGKLASFRINMESGILTPLHTYVVGKNPMWVMLLRMQ